MPKKTPRASEFQIGGLFAGQIGKIDQTVAACGNLLSQRVHVIVNGQARSLGLLLDGVAEDITEPAQGDAGVVGGLQNGVQALIGAAAVQQTLIVDGLAADVADAAAAADGEGDIALLHSACAQCGHYAVQTTGRHRCTGVLIR